MAGDALAAVEGALRHDFSDRHLLVEALTHASYAAEHDGVAHYQRLEFLGDAIVELVTTDMIFAAMPDEPEGQMTKVRAAVVDEPTLATVGRAWGLPPVRREALHGMSHVVLECIIDVPLARNVAEMVDDAKSRHRHNSLQ